MAQAATAAAAAAWGDKLLGCRVQEVLFAL